MRCSPSNHASFEGATRGLVVAIDFGTVSSRVAYAILEPGKTPAIRTVKRYPGQARGASVPSVLFYDRAGNLRAVGAEAYETPLAEKERWLKVIWPKLFFSPKGRCLPHNISKPVLPQGKTSVVVLADYLRYLRQAAQSYIRRTHQECRGDFWDDVEHETTYVLSHPNGWGGFQQSQMREAAILGGLIPSTEAGRSRIRFVSEGEATLHSCIDNGLAADILKIGANIIVADAGGGTIDVSAYQVKSLDPLQLEETMPAKCHLAGSAFINCAFDNYLAETLTGTKHHTAETCRRLNDEFEYMVKRVFGDKFDDDQSQTRPLELRSPGKPAWLTVPAHRMEEFFEPSCSAPEEAIKAQVSPKDGTAILLMGGLSGNPWLQGEIEARLSEYDINITCTDEDVTRAVAEGAASFHLNHYVTARVAKSTYVTPYSDWFDPQNREHLARINSVYREDLSGNLFIPGMLSIKAAEGTVMQAGKPHRSELTDELSTRSSWTCSMRLARYGGAKLEIRWADTDPDNLRDVATFEVDLPTSSCHKVTGRDFREYFQVRYWIVMDFGAVELTCHVEWLENDEVKRRPLSLVWKEI